MQPETAVTAQKRTLQDITSELTAYRDTLEGIGDDGPDADLIRAKIEQIESLHSNKVDAVAAYIRWLASERDQLKADKMRFERRAKQYAALENRLRDYVCRLMDDNSITSMKGRNSTISLASGMKRVTIDLDALPAEYKVVIPQEIIPERVVADDQAIAVALAADKQIDGVKVEDGTPFVRIS